MGIKKAKAKVVMSAYNKVNNIYCSSHDELINQILKKEWKFNGYVVSDWGAALAVSYTHLTLPTKRIV